MRETRRTWLAAVAGVKVKVSLLVGCTRLHGTDSRRHPSIFLIDRAGSRRCWSRGGPRCSRVIQEERSRKRFVHPSLPPSVIRLRLNSRTHRPPSRQTLIRAVVVRFKAVGNAPIMKQNFFRVTVSNHFQAVIQFLRKELGWRAGEPLVSTTSP